MVGGAVVWQDALEKQIPHLQAKICRTYARKLQNGRGFQVVHFFVLKKWHLGVAVRDGELCYIPPLFPTQLGLYNSDIV